MADVIVANTSPGLAGKTLACHDTDGVTSGLWTMASPLALKNGVSGSQTWRESVDGSGNLNLLADGAGGGLSMNMAGSPLFTGDISEKGRTTPLGHWIDVPFNAANFSGLSGATWTVAAGNVKTNRYTVVGKTLTWLIYLAPAGSVAGAPFQLTLVLPAGFVAAAAGAGGTRLGQINDSGGLVEAIAFAPAVGNVLYIQKTNNTTWAAGSLPILLVTVTLEIQ